MHIVSLSGRHWIPGRQRGFTIMSAAPYPPSESGAPWLSGVVLESELGRLLALLVRPPNPTLHLVLDTVERVDLDQGFVLPSPHVPVRAGEAAVHRVAEDVRDRL